MPRLDHQLSEKFDWSINNEAIAIKKQNAIAAYVSTAGDVVIRQQRDGDQQSDSYLLLSVQFIPEIKQSAPQLSVPVLY
jgi:hypothetical protein